MKNHETYNTLKRIKNKYSEIITITETLHYDLHDDRSFRVINQRAKLLTEIEREHTILKNECPQWQDYCNLDSKCKVVKNEIKLLISLALSLDDTLKERLTNRITTTKYKINELHKTSKMALSYAKY